MWDNLFFTYKRTSLDCVFRRNVRNTGYVDMVAFPYLSIYLYRYKYIDFSLGLMERGNM